MGSIAYPIGMRNARTRIQELHAGQLILLTIVVLALGSSLYPPGIVKQYLAHRALVAKIDSSQISGDMGFDDDPLTRIEIQLKLRTSVSASRHALRLSLLRLALSAIAGTALFAIWWIWFERYRTFPRQT